MKSKQEKNKDMVERNKIKKQKGECKQCSNKLSNKSLSFCDYHIKLKKEKKKNKIYNKICTDCGDTALDYTQYCKKCKLKCLSKNHLGSSKHFELLKNKLKEQGEKCYYTGYNIPVEEGNLSIDHIKPVSKYPGLAKDINNMVFCEFSFNLAKNNTEQVTFNKCFYKIIKSFICKKEIQNEEDYNI